MSTLKTIVGKAEGYIEKLLRPVAPKLPAKASDWLADNIWWIALIGAIISGLGVLVAINGLWASLALLGAVSGTAYGYAVAGITTWTLVVSAVSLAFLAVQGVLLGIAVKPLQAKQPKGWHLVFLTLLVGGVSTIISAVLAFGIGAIFSLIVSAAFFLVGAYFLFEIRGYFIKTAKPAVKKATKKTAKK